jgi:DNA-directed RNA polymerase specialized sigma24 family protein
MTEPEHLADAPSRSRRFPTTRWSVVRAAAGTASLEARAALESLCVTYWGPVYAFVRQSGRSADDAQDLTQAFFARVIEKGDFGNARHELGRFRTFLLTAVRHFLSNQADYDRAAKRGGGQAHVPLGPRSDEDARAFPEPSSGETPETIFEQHWALTVLDAAMTRLAQESEGAGDGVQFETLRPFLTGNEDASYAAASQTLEKAEGVVRVAVHRLRRRFGRCLRETLADTVDDPAEIDAELAYLLDVLSRRHRVSSLERR